MIYFILSLIMVFSSSFLVTSTILQKKHAIGFIYIFLLAFAQIVLSFEILSFFSAIKPFWILISNLITLFAAWYFWNKYSKKLWGFDLKSFSHRFINALKLDKSLIWLFIGFLICIGSAFFLCAIMPITNVDAQNYHVLRSLVWTLNQNLNHIEFPDIRSICMPINSEILYTWALAFLKSDIWLGFFAFFGYIISIVCIYNILNFLGFCMRKKLWVLFLTTSIPSVLVQISGTETDIIVAGLILSSIFAFWYGLKENKKTPLFMSSLAYALAIGTKTTAMIAIPGVGLLLLGLCAIYYKKEFYKPILAFGAFFALNFVLFAAFNYVQNFIHFGNFFSDPQLTGVSKNHYGIKGLFANLIKYFFMFFDFTGFKWSDYIGSSIINIKHQLLNSLHLGNVKDGLYSIDFGLNRSLLEPLMGSGILGFLVFLPCLIFSGLRHCFCRKHKKNVLVGAFAITFFVNLIMLSYLITYMTFSARFLMSFIILASPVFVYSYFKNKNPLKYIIVAFAMFYLCIVSTNLWARPFVKIVTLLSHKHSISEIRELGACKDFQNNPQTRDKACKLKYSMLARYSPKNNILFIPFSGEYVFEVLKLNFKGYHIDTALLEDAGKIDFSKYNVIITTNKGQNATYIKYYEKRKNECKKENNTLIIPKEIQVPCVYYDNEQAPKYPFAVNCFFSTYKNRFVKEHNLQLLQLSGIITPKDTSENIVYYMIYQNTKKPAILK